MAGSADLFLSPSKMYGLEEPQMKLTQADLDTLKAGNGSLTSNDSVPWAKSDEGKATIAGAAEGMKSGSLGNTLTSAGIYNMLGAGALTPVGGALAAGGVILNAIDQGNAVDYANKKLVADQQAAAQKNKVAALYQMMGRNYGIS